MGGESADSDEGGMDVDPQSPAFKRGRRSPGKEQQTPAMPPTVKSDKWLGVRNALEGRWPCGCSAPLIA
jgi:hypothetical protein